MDNASYHNDLEKPPKLSWRRDEIIAWLQETRIPFAVRSFKAELQNLATANKSSRKRRGNHINTLSSEYIMTTCQVNFSYNPKHIGQNTKCSDRFTTDELIREHGHEVLSLPPYNCHFNPTGLAWSQAKNSAYHNSNMGRNGFGMEAVNKMWEESLKRVCYSLIHCLKKQYFQYHINFLLLQCFRFRIRV
jgi:hypothetical protein